MKILLINNCHRQRGGADIVYFSTARLLEEYGHQVVFFSFYGEQNEKTTSAEYFISWGNKFRQLRNYFNNYDAVKKLEELLEKEKPDIAHAHLMWGGISGAIIPILHKHGVPIVHTVHDYRMICPAYTFRDGKGRVCEDCKGGRFRECIRNRCSKGNLAQSIVMSAEMYYRNKKWHPAENLDGIIYVSNFARKKHDEFDSRFLNTRSITLYNFTSVGEEYPPLETDGGYYLYYGRLSHEKGVHTLVQVFKNYSQLHLKIVGTGPIEEKLKQISGDNVEFLGFKSGKELFNIVRNAKFVCVPSEWYENNPMTIIESYSMGVPVIGARIGGIPEIVDNGNTGFLFNSGDCDSLRNSIERSLELNENSYREMKKNARVFANNYFEKIEYINKLTSFYYQVIDDCKKEN